MKKLFTYLTMALVTVMMFTSCDELWRDREDREEAFTLEGTWTGYIDTYIYDRYGLSGDSYRTAMYFKRENSYGGWGYEVDYDLYSRYSDYYYCEFEWEVYGGEIRIRYADSWNDVYIYDYSLNDYHFSGYMDDGTTRDIHFNLSYDSRFDWRRYRDYYYVPTRSATASADSTEVCGKGFHASGKFAEAFNNKK